MRKRTLRSVIAISSVATVCVVTALAGSASAIGSKGIKGDPQPEQKPFKVGATDGAGGSVAILANGDEVLAYYVHTKNDAGAARVCVLAKRGHACTHTSTLNTLNDGGEVGSVFDEPQVFALPNNGVDVLMTTCCDSDPSGGDLIFQSTDGGAVFGAATRVGTVNASAAALVGSDIVFTGGDAHLGALVEGVSATTPSHPGSVALVNDNQPIDVGIGAYKDGALVGNDVDAATTTTHIEYAASGSNFDETSAYKLVGTFANEALIGISGNAVLTIQTTHKEEALLRYFNGTSFSAPHPVPGLKGHGLGYWISVDKDPGGVTHVFSETNFSTPLYELFETSTTSGSHWSKPAKLGNGIDYSSYASGLDATGSGIVLGTGHTRAEGFPILAPQRVSFALKKSSLKKGHKTTASGKGAKAATGRKITLQIEKHGKWYAVSTTHEKSNGSFKFKIKATSVGTFHYRAVAADHAGYVQFGYSAARALKVRR
jgi:hypothetical protein